ncbi:MAG: hypothetical protein ABSC53_03770 [Bacteroidota bacterium]
MQYCVFLDVATPFAPHYVRSLISGVATWHPLLRERFRFAPRTAYNSGSNGIACHAIVSIKRFHAQALHRSSATLCEIVLQFCFLGGYSVALPH